MFTVAALKKQTSNSPHKVPIKVKIAYVGATTKYQKDGQEKTHTLLGLADQTVAIKAVCYDQSKLKSMMSGANVMIRNYTFRDQSATKVSMTAALQALDEETKAEAVRLTRQPPPPAFFRIEDAKKAPVTSLVSLKGTVIRVDETVTRTIARTQENVKVRQITIKDQSDEAKVSLWRSLAEEDLAAGKFVEITCLRINFPDLKKTLRIITCGTRMVL